METETDLRPRPPRYKCHKEVEAFQIVHVAEDAHEGGWRAVDVREEGFGPVICPSEMFVRYSPVPGDYIVFYEDGYKSFSPQAAFESGYTLIT